MHHEVEMHSLGRGLLHDFFRREDIAQGTKGVGRTLGNDEGRDADRSTLGDVRREDLLARSILFRSESLNLGAHENVQQ